ncbi:MAG: alpha/beta fold hydrolase [Chloroflexi bacterium]|nr:alpha/beta fold hydrolase [Chloroflexota bacterium]
MGCWLAAAQAAPEVQTISRQSADAVDLVADWYAAAPGAPIVLSLHMLNSRRSAYEPLLLDLRAAGYAVLNVDMRGHGDSAGERDWDSVIADVGDWLAWLEAQGQLSDAGVTLLGASIGANVAIIGCAEHAACRGAIALSPGLDYRGTQPESALAERWAGRAALLIAAQADRGSADSVRQLFASAGGDVTARILPGRAHGTRLFDSDYTTTSRLLLHWLGEHLPVPNKDS